MGCPAAPTGAWAAATAVAVVGLVLRSWGQVRFGDALGVVMALTAGFSLSCYVVAAKAELDRGGHVVELPGLAYLLGSLMLAPLVLSQPLAWVSTPSGTALVLYLGVVTMALANVCAVQGMRGMPPGPAATLFFADPLTATCSASSCSASPSHQSACSASSSSSSACSFKDAHSAPHPPKSPHRNPPSSCRCARLSSTRGPFSAPGRPGGVRTSS